MTPPQIFWRLVRECARFPGRLSVAALSLVAVSIAQLYLTWLVKLWAEGPLAGDDRMMAHLTAAGVVITLVMVAGVFVSRYVLNSVNQRMVEALRDAAFRRLLAARVPAAREHHTGEVMSRFFTDAAILSGFVRDVLKRLIGESIVIAGALAMMFYLQWRLALATCALVPLVLGLLAALGGVIRRQGTRAQRAIGQLGATLSEQLHGLTTIKGFQAEQFERERFVRQNAGYRRQIMHGEWWAGLLAMSVWLITGFGLLAVVGYGSRLVIAGEITAGGIVAFCLYVVQTIEPLRRLSDVQTLLQRALAAAARVFELIDLPDVEPETSAPTRPSGMRGDVHFRGVAFRYRPDVAVLDGVELRLAAGANVALVASSGGGKSTLLNLLPRFLDPQDGAVVLDGSDLRALPLGDLRRAVCVVEQEPFIFSGSLLDNVRYGSWHAPRGAVDDAAQLAGLDPLVSSLPQGWHTVLHEGGRNLSVGQKQRIALARAIVRDPVVLALDEATSALDGDTEQQIFAQLAPWLRRRTVLAVSHRLSTVSRFDRVIVLDHGRIVGDGSVAYLTARCAAFGRLFADQLGRPVHGVGCVSQPNPLSSQGSQERARVR